MVGYDETSYFLTLSSETSNESLDPQLDAGLRLLADLVFHVNLNEEVLSEEKNKLVSQLRKGKSYRSERDRRAFLLALSVRRYCHHD